MSYYMCQIKNSPELMLLIYCAQSTIKGRKIEEFILSQPINWDLFFQIITQHRLVPTVYSALKSLDNSPVPPYVLPILKQEFKKNVLKSMVMANETIKLMGVFHEKGIPALILKGAPLAQKLYGDVSLRISKDIDLLVNSEDIKKAEIILLEEGYEKKTTGMSFTPRQSKAHLTKFHHWVFTHKTKKVCVELHWKMNQIDLRFSVLSKDRSPNTVDIGGYPIPVLPDDEWLFFLMVHGGSHKWLRLRWLFDIDRFIQCSTINWDKIMILAENACMTHLVHQTVLLLHRLCHANFPEKLLKEAVQDKKADKLSDEVLFNIFFQIGEKSELPWGYWKNFWQTNGYRFRLRTGWRRKMSYFFSLVQPIEEDYKFVSLPDSLYPLYYFIRPITWLRRRWKSKIRRNLLC